MRSQRIERFFPKLVNAGYDVTSEDTSYQPTTYNCIAWAAEDTHNNFWWPNGGYWPLCLKREVTIPCFVRAFRLLGYCKCSNSRLESGYEKVALYAKNDIPKHMARQLRDGTWTSKLGDWEDIMHLTLDALDYCPYPWAEYGSPVLFMKRPIPVGWCVRGIQFLIWQIKLVFKR